MDISTAYKDNNTKHVAENILKVSSLNTQPSMIMYTLIDEHVYAFTKQ